MAGADAGGACAEQAGRAEDAAGLVPLVADEVDAVAARAAWAASQTHNPLVVPALVAQLGRGDTEFRNSLSVALAELGADSVPSLAGALRCGAPPEVRRHAADTLSLLGSPDAEGAVLALAEALDDSDQGVRLAALNALGQLRGPSAESVVQACVDADEPLLRDLASRLRTRRPGRRRAAGARAGAGAGVESRAVASGTGIVAAAAGVLVSLECDGAVVAESRRPSDLAQVVADLAAAHPGADAAELLRLPTGDGSVASALDELSWASGEQVTLGRVARCPGRSVSLLKWTAAGGAPRAGALVSFDGGGGAVDVATKVALQVLTCAPTYLSRAQVPNDVLDDVRVQAAARTAARGLSGPAVARIAAGAVEQFVHDSVLLEQVSVADPGRTVDGLLYGKGVRITGFARVEVGVGSV